MPHSIFPKSPTGTQGTKNVPLRHLKEAIEHAAHLLPAQGPITRFIHHNTLHAFEDLPFADAVKKAAADFRLSPLPDGRPLSPETGAGPHPLCQLGKGIGGGPGRPGRGKDPGPLLPAWSCAWPCSSIPLRTGPTEELVWFVAEKDALRRVRSDTSAAVRDQLIAETRRWVMRDLRGGNEAVPGGADRQDQRVSRTAWRGSSTGLPNRHRELERRNLGGIHAAVAVASLLRRRRRSAGVQPPRRPCRSGTGICSWKRPLRTPTCWSTRC